MISTDHPSALVQMVLWCLPRMFMIGLARPYGPSVAALSQFVQNDKTVVSI
jgi:hypothetical protein